jgi:hypothetical protein
MDVLESFAAIEAGPGAAWAFVTQVDKVLMWTSPLIKLVIPPDLCTLDAGAEFDALLNVPGRPILHCLVLSLEDDAVTVKLDGFVRGLITWRVVPAGGGVIAHGQIKYEWVERRWTVPWVLAGRWLSALGLGWLMRQFKARVEDTVGSSGFGVPLLLSPYAVVLGVAVVSVFLGGLILRARKWIQSRG